MDELASLQILDALLSLINKRPHVQLEFKQADGYVLLQRIYTSIACFNKYLVQQQHQQDMTSTDASAVAAAINAQNNYYSMIQKRLFVTLINSCFRQPVFFLNTCYSTDRNDRQNEIKATNETNVLGKLWLPFGAKSAMSTTSGTYLTNPLLLTQVILEWELWIPFDTLVKNRVK